MCNIVEHSPVYGTLIQIPPFLLIVSMLLSKKTEQTFGGRKMTEHEKERAFIEALKDPEKFKAIFAIIQNDRRERGLPEIILCKPV